jgi:hypothetical protein
MPEKIAEKYCCAAETPLRLRIAKHQRCSIELTLSEDEEFALATVFGKG